MSAHLREAWRSLALKMFASKPVWDMSESEFRSMESRLVYHATSYEADYQTLLTQGVRISNVPMNLARQRYLKGEYAEFSPGAGVGMGLYVSGNVYNTLGYGRYVVAIEVDRSDLDIPPESEYHRQYGTIETALQDHNGAIIVKDISSSRVHAVAERFTHQFTDAWAGANDPRWTKKVSQ